MSEPMVSTMTPGSWWQTSSIFGGGGTYREPETSSIIVADREPAVERTGEEDTNAQRAIGGARSQSRFLGKTATPLFREAAMSAQTTSKKNEDILVGGMDTDWGLGGNKSWVQNGVRCDGLPLDAGQQGWVFCFDEWKWVRDNGECTSEMLQCMERSKMEHMIAARRWGDGRDALLRESAAYDATMKRKREVKQENGARGFKSVGGFEGLKKKLREHIVIPLKHRDLCQRLGVAAGRGVLLHGPSGSGKTYVLSRLEQESGVPVITVSCPECVGNEDAENRLKSAFRKATSCAPSILFFDNFEALVPNKDSASSNSIDSFSTNLFVSLLDSLRDSGPDVAVVCATNQLGSIDPSLRRYGRLDTELYMGSPSPEDRLEILKGCIAHAQCAADVDLSALCDDMQGFLAADIAATVSEAALAAVIDSLDGAIDISTPPESLPVIEMKHLIASVQSLRPGVLRSFGMHLPQTSKTSWDDIGGLEDVKNELKELIEWPTHHYSIIEQYGMAMSSGALLYGPPGCGKTLLAKAVAHSCKANFVCINGPEVLQKWMGESERTIREIFAAARLSKPCVVFIDELDALAPRRRTSSTVGASNDGDIAARVVAQLLCEIDGVEREKTSGVIVIGATNRPETIDPALLRPGRLAQLIHVPLPDHEGRISILKKSLSKCPKEEGFDLEEFAMEHEDMFEGFSGADIAELARRASKHLIHASIQQGSTDGIVLTKDHLVHAAEGTRRSVSAQSAAYFNSVLDTMASGTPITGGSSDGHIPMKLAVSLTQQVVQSKCSHLQNRIEELEQLLHQHGMEIPPDHASSDDTDQMDH